MTASPEAQLYTVMDQSFTVHALANSHFPQQINCSLLQNSSPDPLFAILPASGLDDD